MTNLKLTMKRAYLLFGSTCSALFFFLVGALPLLRGRKPDVFLVLMTILFGASLVLLVAMAVRSRGSRAEKDRA